MRKPLHENDCEHDIYLGSNDKSDFYLYLDIGSVARVGNEESKLESTKINICERFGEGGDYLTHMFDPIITNSNGHDLLNKLKEIIWNNQ